MQEHGSEPLERTRSVARSVTLTSQYRPDSIGAGRMVPGSADLLRCTTLLAALAVFNRGAACEHDDPTQSDQRTGRRDIGADEGAP
jgi:hypothetical protein